MKEKREREKRERTKERARDGAAALHSTGKKAKIGNFRGRYENHFSPTFFDRTRVQGRRKGPLYFFAPCQVFL